MTLPKTNHNRASAWLPYISHTNTHMLPFERTHLHPLSYAGNFTWKSAIHYVVKNKSSKMLTYALSPLQLEKYKNVDFGRCPRVYCSGQPCLPMGQSDIPRTSTVKIYCPKCEDIYYPRSKYQGSILATTVRSRFYSCAAFVLRCFRGYCWLFPQGMAGCCLNIFPCLVRKCVFSVFRPLVFLDQTWNRYRRGLLRDDLPAPLSDDVLLYQAAQANPELRA